MTNISESIEIWKDVLGYEGKYKVSTHGRVQRITGIGCKTPRILSQWQNSRGYFKIILSSQDKTSNRLVHRLVAESFLSHPLEYNVVNHINMNQLDNRIENLEWCTQSMNIIHCWSIKKRRKNKAK